MHRYLWISLMIVAAAGVVSAGCGDGQGASDPPTGSATPNEAALPGPDGFSRATIRPGAGFGSIEVGAVRDAVELEFGVPTEVKQAQNEISGGTDTSLIYEGDAGQERATIVLDDQGKVTRFDTVLATMKTDPGVVGVGSWQHDVKTAFPAVNCAHDVEGDVFVCRLGPVRAGEIVTDFVIQDAKVRRISVGRIID